MREHPARHQVKSVAGMSEIRNVIDELEGKGKKKDTCP
jgi:hypothetical protein